MLHMSVISFAGLKLHTQMNETKSLVSSDNMES